MLVASPLPALLYLPSLVAELFPHEVAPKKSQRMNSHEALNLLLADAGVSKIVYALVMPETEQTIDAVLDGRDTDSCEANGRESYHAMFREAWTQKQDAVHEAFFDRWLEWTREVVALEPNDFAYRYPTSGASEGLREAIHAYGARARVERFEPKIHVFDGEYEGYAAYARAAAIPIVSHRRSQWQDAIASMGATDQFYISQPSGIDGRVWGEFDLFAGELLRRKPTVQLMLDLSYVGCVASDYRIDARWPNIAAVFFSLSKPAGVYYHRIGGMFSRSEYVGLFGNKWFKNLSSLRIGTEFMSRYAVRELPGKYRPHQQAAIDALHQQLGLQLQPADILLLAVAPPTSEPSELERYLLRGPADEALVRVCLTARIAHLIDPKLNPQVAARYYEQLQL